MLILRLLAACLILGCLSGSAGAQTGVLYPIKKGDRWGYIDQQGKERIPAGYRSAGAFSEGLAPVRLNGTYGYIDESGSIAIPYQYDYAEPFAQGIATAYLRGKPFLINKRGKALFAHNFTGIKPSGHNRLWVVQSPGGRFGIINQSGQLILDTLYSGIEPFREGKAVIRREHAIPGSDDRQEEAAIINARGNIILPFGRFESLSAVSDGCFAGRYMQGAGDYSKKSVLIDPQGTPMISFVSRNWYIAPEKFRHSLSPVSISVWADDSIVSTDDSYYGAIDRRGSLVFSNTAWKDMTPFDHRRAFVQYLAGDNNGESGWMLINERGQQAGRQTYTNIFDGGWRNADKRRDIFIHSMAFVETADEKWGAIDTNGNFIVEPLNLNAATGCRNVRIENRVGDLLIMRGDAADGQTSGYGFWNARKKIIVRPQFLDIQIDTAEGALIRAITNDLRLTYLDKSGKTVWTETGPRPVNKPVNIDYMTRGYFQASGPARRDLAGFGGWGASDNKAKSVQPATPFKPNELSIVISNTGATWHVAHAGLKVYLANTSHDTVYFPAQDSRLYMNVQARDEDGAWRDIEYLPDSWCGNSYHTAALNPKQYWDFTMPLYEGSIKTKLRIRLEYRLTSQLYEGNSNEVLYSNEVDGNINPAQFWRARDYHPAGLMDPYDE